MAVEMSATTFLAPFFGSSLYIWAILIGLVLVYLTVGYWFGGRLADQVYRGDVFLRIHGHRRSLYCLLAWLPCHS